MSAAVENAASFGGPQSGETGLIGSSPLACHSVTVRDSLDQHRLEAVLVEAGPYAAVRVLEEADSTNQQLLAAPGVGHLTAWLAEHQTAGRGRLDPATDRSAPRTWQAPPHTAILASVAVRPSVPGSQLTLAMALAALEAIDSITRRFNAIGAFAAEQGVAHKCSLKWPNDIMFGSNKVGGVLTQVGQDGRIVIGLGLNVHQTAEQLPSDRATSLSLEGFEVDRTELVIAILDGFARQYRAWRRSPAALVEAAAQRMATIGQWIYAVLPSGQVLAGQATGLDQAGRLMLRGQQGHHTHLDSGDVHHVRSQST